MVNSIFPFVIQGLLTATVISLVITNRLQHRTIRIQRDLIETHDKTLADVMLLQYENAALRTEVSHLRTEPPPSNSELEYVYRSLGVTPPTHIQEFAKKRDETFQAIMDDLEAL